MNVGADDLGHSSAQTHLTDNLKPHRSNVNIISFKYIFPIIRNRVVTKFGTTVVQSSPLMLQFLW